MSTIWMKAKTGVFPSAVYLLPVAMVRDKFQSECLVHAGNVRRHLKTRDGKTHRLGVICVSLPR